jgi:ABC-type dipeptide/oligopeptide/nickel transport system permease subunit
VTARRKIGLTLIALVAICGLFAPFLAPFNPVSSGIDPLEGASARHWLGTDPLGRDVLSRVIYGARISLMVGIGAALIAAVIGVPVGLMAGYFRGRIDLVLVQVIDIFIALPGLVLALIVTAMLGAKALNLALVLGFVSSPTVARLVRGQALQVRQTAYVEAARAAGGGPAWIMARHVRPNIMRTVSAQFAITVSYAIFTSASLSFLGLGVPPPTPDWGGMVREGFEYLSVLPLLSLGPGAAVAVTVMAFYLIGSSVE